MQKLVDLFYYASRILFWWYLANNLSEIEKAIGFTPSSFSDALLCLCIASGVLSIIGDIYLDYFEEEGCDCDEDDGTADRS
jgi:hypothetical protein